MITPFAMYVVISEHLYSTLFKPSADAHSHVHTSSFFLILYLHTHILLALCSIRITCVVFMLFCCISFFLQYIVFFILGIYRDVCQWKKTKNKFYAEHLVNSRDLAGLTFRLLCKS